MRWAELELAAVGDEQEVAAALLTEVAGCHGFAADAVAVRGYLPVDERLEETLLRLREAAGQELTIRFVAEEDWANAWKQYFKPQRIGAHFVVQPTWEAYTPEPGDRVILMDPGMAFGTGLHATTRLCLRALESYLTAGDDVADVGTGSGILAIGAALLGAARVEATDNDPLAVRIAQENIVRNGCDNQVSACEASLPPPGTFTVVVANILPDVILGMADELVAALRPSGVLIASGIIESRANDVVVGLEARGLTVVGSESEGEWVALIARK